MKDRRKDESSYYLLHYLPGYGPIETVRICKFDFIILETAGDEEVEGEGRREICSFRAFVMGDRERGILSLQYLFRHSEFEA